MSKELNNYQVCYSIIRKSDGEIIEENEVAEVKAQREITAMAVHRIKLDKNGFGDDYIVTYHTVTHVFN